MSYKFLSADLQEKICMVLGRQINAAEGGCAQSFFDFSEADVADFRALERKSGILAVSYIRFKLAGNVELDAVTSYYGSVVQHGMSVEEWSSAD